MARPVAAVVTGYGRQWVVVLGPVGMDSATVVDGDRRTPVPLRLGWGAVPLDALPGTGAYVTTPSGRVPVTAGPVREMNPRG